MAHHPDSQNLSAVLARFLELAAPWSAVVYRATSPKYATKEDLLTGFGSRKHAGRWNPKGLFPALYASPDPETAMAEVLEHYRYYQLPIESAMPKVFVSITVHLQQVLRILPSRNRDLWRALAISRNKLRNEDWRELQEKDEEARTQAIGRLCWESKLEGLLVPSLARANGVNLVVFPDNLMQGSNLQIINVADLAP